MVNASEALLHSIGDELGPQSESQTAANAKRKQRGHYCFFAGCCVLKTLMVRSIVTNAVRL